MQCNHLRTAAAFVAALGGMALMMAPASAQSGAATGAAGLPIPTTVFTSNEHISFDRPEAWGLKYFAAATLLSGLEPADSGEEHHPWSINVGLETGWLPTLNAGQEKIGFNGTAPENLNQAPVFIRPVVRIGLPWKLKALVAAPPPVEVFGITPRLLAFGLERPIAERRNLTVGWRGYGQVGFVKGAFTCPNSVLAFPPGSPGNPEGCLAASNDKATLRYAGGELQASYKIPRAPRLVPHATVGGTFVDGVFQVEAIDHVVDHSHLWTHGGILSATGGLSYLLTQRIAFTVDVFYSPLEVKRSPTSPLTNDGLFNVRALLSYTFR